MVIRSLNLETVCGITSKLPENEHPEIAFAGKQMLENHPSLMLS